VKALLTGAAYTAVDKAKSEPGLALAVNGWAPAAGERRLCVQRSAGQPLSAPSRPAIPSGPMGRTKAAGE